MINIGYFEVNAFLSSMNAPVLNKKTSILLVILQITSIIELFWLPFLLVQ